MKQNKVILAKGIDIEKLKELLDYSFYENDMVINHTANPKEFVVSVKGTTDMFVYGMCDMMANEDAKDFDITGWFTGNENIFRSILGTSYMMTSTVDEEGELMPLIVGEDGKCFTHMDFDVNEVFEDEDEEFFKDHDFETSTCIHPTDQYKAEYRPCNLPQTTTSEQYHSALEEDEDDSLSNNLSFFMRPLLNLIIYEARMSLFFEKFLGKKVGGWVATGISIVVNTLVIAFLTSAVFVGFNYASDTVMDYNCSLWDGLILAISAGVLITVIYNKGVKFTKGFLEAVGFSSFAAACVAGWACFLVFGYNSGWVLEKVRDDSKEVRTKVTDSYETSSKSRSSYYMVEFDLPFSKGHYSFDVDQDGSFKAGDTCTVFYHNGNLGLDVIDGVKH